MPAPIWIILLFFILFSSILFPEVDPCVCHTILNYTMFNHAMNSGSLYKFIILIISILETFTPLPSLGKYKLMIP